MSHYTVQYLDHTRHHQEICEYDIKLSEGEQSLLNGQTAWMEGDLFRKNNQPEQSYSERQMFQTALERLAREVAAIEKTDYFNATEKIENTLFKR